MTRTTGKVAGYGLAAGAVGWQGAEFAQNGMPTTDLQWAEFALRALMMIVGIFVGRKG